MVEPLVQLIRQYIALIDALPGPTARDFLLECAIILPQIYSLAHQLPDVELENDQWQHDLESPESPIGRIMLVLGPHDLYREVFDPISDTDVLTNTLSNDLSDIYVDLKASLIKYDSGEEGNRLEAIWEWRFMLVFHWGHHLVGALRPIHSLVHNHLGPENDESKA